MRTSTTSKVVAPQNLYEIEIDRELDLTLDGGLVTWKVMFGSLFEATYLLATLIPRQIN